MIFRKQQGSSAAASAADLQPQPSNAPIGAAGAGPSCVTPSESLRAARAVIAEEARWTQRVSARDRYDNPVVPSHENAVCFCAVGALEKTLGWGLGWVLGIGMPNRFLEPYNLLRRGCGEDPEAYNDTHTHAEVLAAFDRAIALAEAA